MEIEEIELCVVCNEPGPSFYSKQNNENEKTFCRSQLSKGKHDHKTVENDESDSLLPQLRVIFLLQQIFKYPLQDDTTLETMQKLGDPAGWLEICKGCSELIDLGINVLRKKTRYEKKHKRIVDKLEEKFLSSKLSLPWSLKNYILVQNQSAESSITASNFRKKVRQIDTALDNCEIKHEPGTENSTDLLDWDSMDAGFEDPSPSFDINEPVKEEYEESSTVEHEILLPGNEEQSSKSNVSNDIDTNEQESEHGVTSHLREQTPSQNVANKRIIRTSTRRKCKRSDINYGTDSDIDDDNENHSNDIAEDGGSSIRDTPSISAEFEVHNTPPVKKASSRKKSYKHKTKRRFIIKDSDGEEEEEDRVVSNSVDMRDKNEDERQPSTSTKLEIARKLGQTVKKRDKKYLKWFYDRCDNFLDMNLVVYPPKSEEDKLKIPKIGRWLRSCKEEEKTEKSVKKKQPKKKIKRKRLTKRVVKEKITTGFPCPSCEIVYYNKYKTIAHIHHAHLGIKEPWRCNQCPYRSQAIKSFKAHIRSHLDGKLKTCKLCDQFTCRQQMTLDYHVINHQKDVSTPTCHECQQSFINFKAYVNHMTEKHGLTYSKQSKNKLVCELCSKMLPSNRALEFHLLKIHQQGENNGKFPMCSECGEIFFRNAGLTSHIAKAHIPEELIKYFCEHCGKEFALKQNLEAHLKYVHMEQKIQNCHVCGMESNNSKKLQCHIKKHHLETCDMSLQDLSEYIKKKQEEKPFKCKLCTEAFPFSVLLYHHYRENHPDVTKKFKCELCGKGFSRQSSVKRHQEDFHMNFEVTCEDCGKVFKKGGSFGQHRRKHCSLKKRKEKERTLTTVSNYQAHQQEEISSVDGIDDQRNPEIWSSFEPAMNISSTNDQDII